MGLLRIMIGTMFTLYYTDGCEMGNHTEFNLGEVIKSHCPCEEFVFALVEGQHAQRVCGGSYTNGAQWLDVDYNQCITVTDDITKCLCDAAKVQYIRSTIIIPYYSGVIAECSHLFIRTVSNCCQHHWHSPAGLYY